MQGKRSLISERICPEQEPQYWAHCEEAHCQVFPFVPKDPIRSAHGNCFMVMKYSEVYSGCLNSTCKRKACYLNETTRKTQLFIAECTQGQNSY